MAPLRKIRWKIRRMAGFPHPVEIATERDIQKGLSVVRKILGCTDEELHSSSFILDTLLEFGMSKNDWHGMREYAAHINQSQFGTQQYPAEFVDFLMELLRFDIETAAEIGVWRGGTAYFSAAVLQRKNPNCRYTLIDIADNLLGYEQFSELLNLEKAIPATSDDMAGRVFDYVFIDADHSYDGAKRDYLNLGKHARKVCALHDIYAHEYDHQNGGTVRLWQELRSAEGGRAAEFSRSPFPWMGIGMLTASAS